MTSSNGNIFRVTGPLCGEFTGPGEFPTQSPVTRSFDVFFDLCLNKRLSKQSWGWWFETPSWSLWRQCNEMSLLVVENSWIVCPWWRICVSKQRDRAPSSKKEYGDSRKRNRMKYDLKILSRVVKHTQSSHIRPLSTTIILSIRHITRCGNCYSFCIQRSVRVVFIICVWTKMRKYYKHINSLRPSDVYMRQ